MNIIFIFFPFLLPPAVFSACTKCSGADKTSAKRLKMPNKSVFTRLAGIEPMEIFKITNQIDHEVCAQQCDAHVECAVFEFKPPRKCIMGAEYARLREDLAKGAFETIVFVKVRGKFTKSFPKDIETCLDKAEYEDYVKHEVDKWLAPSPRRTTSAYGRDIPTTLMSEDYSEDDDSSAESGTASVGGGTSASTEALKHVVSTGEERTPSATAVPKTTAGGSPTRSPQVTTEGENNSPSSTMADATTTTPLSETSLPNYSTTVGSVEVEESVATSVPTYGQSSETPETTPQGAEGGETTLEPTTTRRGEESTRGDSLTTDKVIIFEGRISSVKYSKYVRGSGGQVQLSLTAADKWTLFKSGDKVEIKLSATGSFLGADEKTGKVFLTDDSQKWEIERNIDGTVSFSVNSQWLSATSDDRLVVAPKAMRFKSEMFILE